MGIIIGVVSPYDSDLMDDDAQGISRRDFIGAGVAGATSLLASGLSDLSVALGETKKVNFDFDTLIVGGGPAGLSAALTLGRISRTALLCDDNRPRNAPSKHVNNFPTRDGVHPREWVRLARKDLEKYNAIKLYDGSVTKVEKAVNGFKAKLESGSVVSVKKVILAYGVRDKLPPVAGFKELWGKAIFHCPFCHGFEIRGSKLGFVISNDSAFHALPMIHSLSSDLVVFTNLKMKLSEEQRTQLTKRNIPLIEEGIERLQHEEETLKSVELASGKRIERQYLFYNAELPFELKSDIGSSLGCQKNQFGLYQVNEMSATSTPGVFAAGDNMSPGHSVLLASASGAKAGMAVISQLLQEG